MSTRRQFLGASVGTAVTVSLGAVLAPAMSLAAEASSRRSKPAAVRTADPRTADPGTVDPGTVDPGIVDLGDGLFLFTGAGCNVVALRGPQGSLLVDGGLKAHSRALLRAASDATGNRRVATLINTHWHPAQTGSNETVGRDGAILIAHEVTKKYLGRAVTSVDYLYGPLEPAGRPSKVTRDQGEIEFAGQPVRYGYLPAAHTNGDLYIHFPAANLLVAGGPVASESWPMLDYRNGAWLGGLVRAHETLAALAQPDTRVVPAHGRLLSGAELKQHHAMYADFHERMVVFQNKGYDSGDCIAQQPLKEHEAHFGDAADFIRGAFHSLNLAYSPD